MSALLPSDTSSDCIAMPTLCFVGVTDHLAESEPHAISIARNILGNLNMATAGNSPSSSLPQASGMVHREQLLQGANSLPVPAWEEPLFPAEELRGDPWQNTNSNAAGVHRGLAVQ